MKCILEEFNDIQKAENYINECIDDDSYIKGANLIPYAKSEYVTHYVVVAYKSDKEEESNTMGFKS